MILGAEIALLFVGFYALITGRMPSNQKAKFALRGWPARVVGLICLLPIPLSAGIGLVVGVFLTLQGQQVTFQSFYWTGVVIEATVLVCCLAAAGVMSRVFRMPKEPLRENNGGDQQNIQAAPLS